MGLNRLFQVKKPGGGLAGHDTKPLQIGQSKESDNLDRKVLDQLSSPDHVL